MRICDAGKRASADLSPAICGLASLALVQIKSPLRGNSTTFLSIILQIKDMEQVIIERIQALMLLLLPAIKRNTIICDQNASLCIERHQRSALNLSLCYAAMPRE